MGPRDQSVRFAVPVNFETGEELTTRQQMALAKLTERGDELAEVMHEAEGTVPGDEFMSRRMKIAATHLETALMFARKAALETK